MSGNTIKLEVSLETLEKLIKQWNVLIKNPNLDKTGDFVLKMIEQVNTLSINKNENLAEKIKTMHQYNQHAIGLIRLKLSLEARKQERLSLEARKQERLQNLKPNEIAAGVAAHNKSLEKLKKWKNNPIPWQDVIKKGTEQAKQAKQGEGKISIKVHRLI